MIQYHHRFVPHPAELLGLSIDMPVGKPKPEKKLALTSDCEALFNKTKNIFSQALLLVFFSVINASTN